MAKTFYHNITSGLVNESDTIELMDSYSRGDTLYKSESGNSLITLVTSTEIESLKKSHQEHYTESE